LVANGSTHVDIPIQERTVHKRVPAVVHWATVEGQDRTDDETIGEAIIYEDGTSDVIIFSDISEGAKKLVGIINQRLDNYSIEED
jgi:hypothetical protein